MCMNCIYISRQNITMWCHDITRFYHWVLFHYVVLTHCIYVYELIYGPPQLFELMQSNACHGSLDLCLWNRILGCPKSLSPCQHMPICTPPLPPPMCAMSTLITPPPSTFVSSFFCYMFVSQYVLGFKLNVL